MGFRSSCFARGDLVRAARDPDRNRRRHRLCEQRALQAALPTQMFWALLLGIMAMIVTFKVPSILGQGSLQESFISTISFAAVGMQGIGLHRGWRHMGGPLGLDAVLAADLAEGRSPWRPVPGAIGARKRRRHKSGEYGNGT